VVDVILWVVLPLLAFGIIMIFFAWAGSVLARRRIARLLGQDEIVLRKAEAIAVRAGRFSFLSVFLLLWEGTLYVTDRRLVWRRYLLAIRGPGFLDIALDDVDECSVRAVGWFGLLQIKVGDELLWFRPHRGRLSPTSLVNRAFAEDMATAINEARAGATTS
jgi:hypothetical protein